jgi:hypothetical protein
MALACIYSLLFALCDGVVLMQQQVHCSAVSVVNLTWS